LERVKQDSHREIANLEALERRELEFQQLQEKEKERAMNAQQKLRELASQELKERISLERELAKQQQQNLLLQKQSEIDKLQCEADKRLFEQKLAEKQKGKGDTPTFDSHSFESIVVEPSSPDTPPASQNRPRLFHKQSVVAAQPVVQEVSSSEMLDTMTSHSSVSQVTGLDLGVAMATGKLPARAQAAACCGPDALGSPLSMADTGVVMLCILKALSLNHRLIFRNNIVV